MQVLFKDLVNHFLGKIVIFKSAGVLGRWFKGWCVMPNLQIFIYLFTYFIYLNNLN